MEESVAETDYNALQQFISDSPWSARGVFDHIAVEASELLGEQGKLR